MPLTVARKTGPASDGSARDHESWCNVVPVANLAAALQMAFGSGAKRILIIMSRSRISQPCLENYSPNSRRAFIPTVWKLCLRRWAWIEGVTHLSKKD
jgi:hypothetical protein